MAVVHKWYINGRYPKISSLSIWLLGDWCIWVYTIAPNKRVMNFTVFSR